MKSIANAIASQEPVAIGGTWQRHLPARFRDRAMEGRAAYSRWGTPGGFPLLYLGRPTDSVTVEAYRHLIDPVDDPRLAEHITPRVLVSAEVKVTEVLDLRTSRARMELGLTLSQMQSETSDRAAYQACQEVAAAAHQQGLHGVIAPAATLLGETLVLFSNLLPATEVPEVVDEIYWDRLPVDPRSGGKSHLSVVRND